jgi:hypothetical protein
MPNKIDTVKPITKKDAISIINKTLKYKKVTMEDARDVYLFVKEQKTKGPTLALQYHKALGISLIKCQTFLELVKLSCENLLDQFLNAKDITKQSWKDDFAYYIRVISPMVDGCYVLPYIGTIEPQQ